MVERLNSLASILGESIDRGARQLHWRWRIKNGSSRDDDWVGLLAKPAHPDEPEVI